MQGMPRGKPVRNRTTFFYGFLVTATSLLIAAHAFEQINDPALRLALQRKGLDACLRRLVLEELIPSTLEMVEKGLVERHRCRGCLRVEQAKRSAVTLALCLLRSGVPAELRQMVMDLVPDGDIGGPVSLRYGTWRTIRGLVSLRRDAEEFPGGAGDERSLRWTDVFCYPDWKPAEQCYICAVEGEYRSFRYEFDSDQEDVSCCSVTRWVPPNESLQSAC